MKSRINKLGYKLSIDIFETKRYYKSNKLHRENDLPAVIRKDGTRVWYKNGIQHRHNNNSNPSTILSDGRMAWWENGKPNRIFSDGEMYLYENGEFIRNNKNEIEN